MVAVGIDRALLLFDHRLTKRRKGMSPTYSMAPASAPGHEDREGHESREGQNLRFSVSRASNSVSAVVRMHYSRLSIPMRPRVEAAEGIKWHVFNHMAFACRRWRTQSMTSPKGRVRSTNARLRSNERSRAVNERSRAVDERSGAVNERSRAVNERSGAVKRPLGCSQRTLACG
jgi:hypothetical protein